MAHEVVEKMIQERAGQVLRRLLNHNEDVTAYIPDGLPPDFRQMVVDDLEEFIDHTRKLVKNEVNEFKAMCIDLLHATARDDVVVNEHWAELIREIHSAVTTPERRPRPAPIKS